MKREFTKGLWRENPVLILMLGLCPALAVSVSVKNAVGMGLAASFVLVASNTIISLFGRYFPHKIRIPCYIVVIATFVTMVEMVMGAYLPALNAALGIFIPLIVVNCIILGRAEACASHHSVLPSVLDGLGMGLGFGLALGIVAFIREVTGSGKFWDITIASFYSPEGSIEPAAVMVMAPGAFFVIAFIMGFLNWRKQRQLEKQQRAVLVLLRGALGDEAISNKQ
ncbi:MAG: electron transport complex subunit RsxE [Pseudomonadota bacterium]